ncbi:uncharacterized protein LOC107022458 [Solanum pennellii]|uniref:Uncharacterized protein LOC107022458 n=1 Tax=Solanum pennellii TaxID=28526 RepID=A0ABM1VDE3_SOLPN|nr:uncharacterized protein LOC107022458 [Solanum pennellii]
MTTSHSKLSLKLLIDPKAKKVLFAEAEKDCVDFLFHILSLPVSTVIRLLKTKGLNYGCLRNLYDSVENLNETYIQSNQDKNILLKPKSPVGIFSVPFLALNDVPAQKISYGCSRYACGSISYSIYYVTDDPNSKCPNCWYPMSRKLTYLVPQEVKEPVGTTGTGFVKEAVKYMVMDDLVVKPISVVSSITALNSYFNIKDVSSLQEKVVNLGMEEALKLLKASFESKTVLTSVFMTSAKRKRAFHFPKERKFYRCNSKCTSFVTEVYKSICPVCKNYMIVDVYNANPGVTCGFVKEMVKYMVMDDLVVKPMSAVSSITALKENFKIKDIASLQEEEVVSFGIEEIDTKAKKILFAEAEKSCVDFLFLILSLPVATVIKLLKKKGMNYGCLPKLYDSVDNLNDNYIQSKDSLLKPKSSVIGIASIPFLSIDDVPMTHKTIYGCSNYSYSHNTVSDCPSAKCTSCNSLMTRILTYVAPPIASGAVASTSGFVKDVVTYMVMDDLVIKPMSTISSITLLNKFNVKDVGVLQEEVVHFGMEEALKLLKASFESKTVLTSVFMSAIKLSK